MLPETIEYVIAELDSAIHYENKPAQQQYRNSINIIDFKINDLLCNFMLMDCRIQFGNDGFYPSGSFKKIGRTCARQVPSLKQGFRFAVYHVGYF